jgi:hypothetical protein
LGAAENFVVFLRRDMAVVQSGDDCAVRIRKLPVAVGFDRGIVAQNRTKTVEVDLFMATEMTFQSR